MMLSRQDIIILSIVLLLALLMGWSSGAFGWSLFIAALIWSILQYREKTLLQRWSAKPISRPLNVLDSWQEVSLRLYQTIRTERTRHRRTLRQFKTFRSITDALPDAALIIDNAGNIENLNNAALQLFHLNPADRGNHLASLVRDPEFSALIKGQIDGDLIEFPSPFNEQIRLEARRIDMSLGQVSDRATGLPYERSMILVRDVTELNRLLSMRQDFIANVSHELRTPLTVIVGYVESLLNEELDRETTTELIGRLLSPTTRMRALVDDLLLLTRLESSPIPTDDEIAPVDMSLLIDTITADAEVLSGGRHVFEIAQSSNEQILGIDGELHSACLNLITNAVRYSPDGGAIRVSWEDIPGGVRFAVEDHG
ncbi:MAG: phosphate regulon sensor protein PhoR, partial [Pseudomonadales bacterium]